MKVSARSRARQLAVQGLYEWQISGNAINDIFTQCLEAKKGKNLDEKYFKELIYKVSSMVEALNNLLKPFLSREMAEIDPIERAILQLGAYELSEKADIPYKVVINEAIELAKTFGAEQSHKFVNGILDKVAEQNRAAEFKANKK
ncbi:transcription antitermination factor NusB [Beggiatoa alba]|nr:transcription antitermination factor NusB [Beggiatoa alba]